MCDDKAQIFAAAQMVKQAEGNKRYNQRPPQQAVSDRVLAQCDSQAPRRQQQLS